MEKRVRLGDLAAFVTSKNAGPFLLTVDVVFSNREAYERVTGMNLITPEEVARLYGIPREQVLKVVFFSPASAIKVTFRRPVASGNLGDTDVYGAQQHVPLMEFEVPWEDGDGDRRQGSEPPS